MKKTLKVFLIILTAIILLPLIALLIFLAWLYIPRHLPTGAKINQAQWQNNYTYVFVHGLSGWGHYDDQYKSFPYWGMLNGDLMKYLGKKGFDAHAASVAPTGSAWDRACELYAQLTGTRVDYGKAHSEKMGHERYGRDFSSEPLIDKFSAEDKINLLGHSFGGVTVRLFVSLMAQGSAEEIEATPVSELSPFFAGGKSDWINSVVLLAAPNNGTSDYHADNVVEVSNFDKKMSGLMSSGVKPNRDSRSEDDYAAFDMHLDRAMQINDSLALPDHIYYFSIPCDATVQNKDGTYSPKKSMMEFFYREDSERMGHYTGVTQGGFVIGPEWQRNDGLVNTISAMYPSGQPHTDFNPAANPESVKPGLWNVFPVYRGDHMSLQGGMIKRNDVRKLYSELLDMINRL